MRSREKIVNLARSWIGKNEADGSYKSIIDIYNEKAKPLPRGVKMQYDWAWCACTWSALALSLGYEDVCPIEISCGEILKQAKKNHIWKASGFGVNPLAGDGILYDLRNNDLYPDHIGIIEYVNVKEGYITVIEGNYSKSVKRRTIPLNEKYILGYITPKYDDMAYEIPEINTSQKDVDTIANEVISGLWGVMPDREKNLTAAGYNYHEVQNRVNDILNGNAVKPTNPNQPQERPKSDSIVSTCYAELKSKSYSGTYRTNDDLYLRNDAGTNKKALCIIPKGTKVKCYGFYTIFKGVPWLYIQVIIDGIEYIGFSSSKFLIKID